MSESAAEKPASGDGEAQRAPQEGRRKREDAPIALAIGVAALAVAVGHAVAPDKIDAVTLGLVVLAAVPWLRRFVSEFPTPWGPVKLLEDRLEGVERKQEQETNRVTGLAESVAQQTEAALLPPERPAEEPPTDERLQDLAAEYNRIRAIKESGPDRTAEMTRVVRQLIDLAPQLTDSVPSTYLSSGDRGLRLAAYAYLYARPDPVHLTSLVASVSGVEDKPFGQYWGIQAIRRVLEQMREQEMTVAPEIAAQLESYRRRLRPGTDRHFELSRIFEDRLLPPQG
jgi:hypothetical protein